MPHFYGSTEDILSAGAQTGIAGAASHLTESSNQAHGEPFHYGL